MPSVTYPFIPEQIWGGMWDVPYHVMGLMPVSEDFDLGIIENKDRYGFPNYGDGPFFYSKIWPEKLVAGATEYPPAFLDFTVSARPGSGAIYYDDLQGSFDEGRLFYVVYSTSTQYLWWPAVHMRSYATMYILQKGNNGDWYYTIHTKESGWDEFIPNNYPASVVPVPSKGRVREQLAKFTWHLQGEYRITTNGKITSDRVVYMRPIPSADAALEVQHIWQIFESANALDIYVGGVASTFQAAYVDACQSLIDVSINTLGNILELANTLKGMAELLREPAKGIKDLLDTYKDPRKAWLFYRYSYSTTKADVKEYLLFIDRLKSLSNMVGKEIKAYGKAGTVHCTVTVNVADILPETVYDFLAMIGVEPNAQNIWDLVPYSFVADWFLGISNVLEWFDNWTYSMTIEPGEIWLSDLREGQLYRVYYRLLGRKLNVPPVYFNKEASGKTWRMRLADAFSLFT